MEVRLTSTFFVSEEHPHKYPVIHVGYIGDKAWTCHTSYVPYGSGCMHERFSFVSEALVYE